MRNKLYLLFILLFANVGFVQSANLYDFSAYPFSYSSDVSDDENGSFRCCVSVEEYSSDFTLVSLKDLASIEIEGESVVFGDFSVFVEKSILSKAKPDFALTKEEDVSCAGFDLSSYVPKNISSFSSAGGTFKYFDSDDKEISHIIAPPTLTSGAMKKSYYVVFVENGTNSESSKKYIELTFNPRPVVSLKKDSSHTDNFCAPSKVDLETFVDSNIVGTFEFYKHKNCTSSNKLTETNISTPGTHTYYAICKAKDTYCASDPVEIKFTINEQPSFKFTKPEAVCTGDVVDLNTFFTDFTNGTTMKYYETYENGSLSNEVAGDDVTKVTKQATYYAQLHSETCESEIQAVTVKFYPKPMFVFTQPDPVCWSSGATFDLGSIVMNPPVAPGSSAKYTFYSDKKCSDKLLNLNVSLPTNPTVDLVSNPPVYGATKSYYVKYTTENGCVSSPSEVKVVFNAKPTVDEANIDFSKTVCEPDTVMLRDLIKNQSKIGDYLFYKDKDLQKEVASTTVVSASKDATKSFYVIHKNHFTKCVSEKQEIKITINKKPVISIKKQPERICEPEKVNLTSVLIDNVHNINDLDYKFYSDKDLEEELTGENLKVSVTKTYYVVATSQSTTCESVPVEIYVKIDPKPDFDLLQNEIVVCDPYTADLKVAVPATTLGTYTFYDSSSNPINPDAVDSGAYTVVFTSNSGAKCSSVAKTVKVVVNPKPSAPNVSDELTAVCYPKKVELKQALPKSLPPNLKVKYFSEESFPVEIENTLVSNSGTYFIVFENEKGCSTDRQPVKVTIHNQPEFEITQPQAVCSPDKVDIADAKFLTPISDANKFKYNFFKTYDSSNPDTPPSDKFTTTTISEPVAGKGLNATYYIQLENIVTGCKSIVKAINVVIHPKPTITLTQPSKMCDGSTYDLQSAVPVRTDGEYLFYRNGSTTPMVNTVVSQGGTYEVVFVNSTTKCESDKETIKVIINPKPVIPALVAGFELERCEVEDSATNKLNLIDAVDSSIQTGTKFYVNEDLTTELINTEINTPGVYNLYMQYTDANNCKSDKVPFTVTIHPKPEIPVVTIPAIACGGTSVDLKSTVPVITEGEYLFYDTNKAPIVNKVVTATGTYYVSYKNKNGCESKLEEIEVKVINQPIPNFDVINQTPLPVKCSGSFNLLDYVDNTSPADATYAFYKDAGLTEAVPNAENVTESHTYYVQLTNNDTGCVSAVKTIEVKLVSPPEFTLKTTDLSTCSIEGGSPSTVDLMDAVDSNPLVTGQSFVFSEISDFSSTLTSTIITDTSNGNGEIKKYFVKLIDTPNNCGVATESPIKEIIVSFRKKPVFVVNNPPKECGATTVDLTSTVPVNPTGTYSFYDTETGKIEMKSTIVSAVSGVPTKTYYVEFKDKITTCVSKRLPISVEINNKPEIELSPITSVCYPAKVDIKTGIKLNGTQIENYKFYKDKQLTLPISDTEISKAGAHTFYVQFTDPTTSCFSDVEQISFDINTYTDFDVIQPDAVCLPNNVDLTTTVPNYSDLDYKFYETKTSLTAVVDPTQVGAGKYYVEFTDPITKCVAPRKEINVIGYDLPIVNLVSPTPLVKCSGNYLNLKDFVNAPKTDEVLEFSTSNDDFSSPNLVSNTVVSEENTGEGFTKIFYVRVKNRVTKCLSEVKSFTVNIHKKPTFTITDTNPEAQCGGTLDITSLVGSEIPTGGTFKYYTSSSLQTPISESEAKSISISGNYYVQYTDENSCKSDVKKITTIINVIPKLHVIKPSPVCEPTKIQLLDYVPSTDDGVYTFYKKDASNQYEELTDSEVSESGDYFVAFKNNDTNCFSDKEKIEVVINKKATFTVVQPVAKCDGEIIDLKDLSYTPAYESDKYKFYSDFELTAEVTNTEITTDGVYYVTYKNSNDCESDSQAVHIKFNPLPKFDVIQPPAVCNGDKINLENFVKSNNVGVFNFYTADPNTNSALSPLAIKEVTAPGTYFVQFVDGVTSCKSEVKFITVVVNPLPDPNTNNFKVIQPTAVCEFDKIDLITTVPKSNIGTYKFYSDDKMEKELANTVVDKTGIYYVQFTMTATGCKSEKQDINVTINKRPTFTLTKQPDAVCDTTVDITSCIPNTLDISKFKFYSDADLNAPVINAQNISVAGDYFVTYQDSNTCVSLPQKITVVINKKPNFTILEQPKAVCSPDTVLLDDPTVLPAPPLGHMYKFYTNYDSSTKELSGNITNVSISEPSVGVGLTKTYYVQLINTKTTCVSEVKSINVKINKLPELLLTTNLITVCQPDRVFLSQALPNTKPSVDGEYKYYRDEKLDNEMSGTEVSANGEYYITYTDKLTGCTSKSQKVEVIINKKPVIAVNQPLAVCGGTITLTDVDVKSDMTEGEFKYYDSSELELSDNQLTISKSGVFYVSYISDKNCESDKKKIFIKINNKPIITVKQPKAICFPEKIKLSDYVSSTVSGTFKYYEDDQLKKPISNLEISKSGEFFVQFTQKSTGCLSESEKIKVTINSKPTFSVEQPKAVCFPDKIDLKDYVKDYVNATPKFYSDPNLKSELSTTQIGSNGTFYIVVEDNKDSTKCVSDIKKITVTINPLPTDFEVIQPKQLCGGTINLTSTVPVKSGGNYTFYDASDNVISELQISKTGTFFVDFTSVKGCKIAKKKINVVINDVPTISIATTLGPITICSSTTTDIADLLTPVAGHTYFFFKDKEMNVPLKSTVIGSPGKFYVKLVNDDSKCESKSEEISVKVIDKPTFEVIPLEAVCKPAKVDVTKSVPTLSSIGEYKFYLDAEAKQEITDLNISESKTIYVKYILSGDTKCESSIKTINVIVNDKPSFTLLNDELFVCETSTVDLRTVLTPTNSEVYRFYKDSGLKDSFTDTFVGAGTYHVQLENPVSGCTSEPKKIIVKSYPKPKLEIKSSVSVCEPDTFDVSSLVPTTDKGSYAYFSDDELEVPLGTTIVNESSTVYIQYTDGTTNCKSLPASVTVTINKKPTFKVTNPKPVCKSTLVDLRNSVPFKLKGTYVFYKDRDSKEVLVDKRVSEPGNYFVRYTSETGCDSDLETITVVFNSAPPKPIVSISKLAQCYEFDGNVKIDNYDKDLEYVFEPSTLSVDSNGAIIGYDILNNYSVKTKNATGCFSEPTTFKIDNACIKLIKTAIVSDNLKLGDVIIYNFVITNQGSVPLTEINLIDKNIKDKIILPKNILNAGESISVEAEYIVTQSDIDAGQVTNSAEVTSIDPDGNPVTDISDDGTDFGDTDDDATVTPILKNADITLNKFANVEKYNLGETIIYTFKVKNTGNVVLKDISVKDNMDGLSPISPSLYPELQPGEMVVFEATYVTSQRDIDNEEISNTATVYAKDPSFKPITDISDNGTPEVDEDGDGLLGNDATVVHAKFIPDITVYNLFSPYSEANTVFTVRSKSFDKFNLSIFNRWGQTVYKSKDYKNDWDGRISKKDSSTITIGGDDFLPTGTYFYMLKATASDSDNKVTKKGWLYIVTK